MKLIQDLTKDRPNIYAISLLLTIVIGGFAGEMYVTVNEQRLALMEQRLKNQEDISKKQKNVIDAFHSQLTELRQGVRSLSTNLTSVKAAATKLMVHNSKSDKFSKEITAAINVLESDANKLDRSITQSEAIARAFSTLLSAAETGDQFDTKVFLSALSGNVPEKVNIEKMGSPISKEELKPGDLVFFNANRRALGPIRIYAGEKSFINVPQTIGVVKVEKLDSWDQQFNEARRITSPTDQPLVQELSTLVPKISPHIYNVQPDQAIRHRAD